QKLPSRYEDQKPGAYDSAATPARLKPVDQQFPVLCPPYSPDSREPTPMDHVDDDFDSFTASRGWLAYALDPLPPPSPEAGPRIPMDASKKYRLPRKGMMLILLRQQPAQSQTSHAERLEHEGWYDEKWDVSDWFPGRSVALGRKP